MLGGTLLNAAHLINKVDHHSKELVNCFHNLQWKMDINRYLLFFLSLYAVKSPLQMSRCSVVQNLQL